MDETEGDLIDSSFNKNHGTLFGAERTESHRANPWRAPAFMMHPDRDADKVETLDYFQWLDECQRYWHQNFWTVERGLAPYKLVAASGSVLTHRRGVALAFNLRARIFKMGYSVARGRRVFVNSEWWAKPRHSSLPLLDFARVCVQMHQAFADVFLEGRMVGQTRILVGQKVLAALWLQWRSFHDLPDLVDNLPLDGAGSQMLADAFGFGTDQEFLQPLAPPDESSEPAPVPNVLRVTCERFQHMVWEKGKGVERKVLYVFVNVGNTGTQSLKFEALKGLSEPASGHRWQRQTHRFTHADGHVVEDAVDVQPGTDVTESIRQRSTLAVEFRQV